MKTIRKHLTTIIFGIVFVIGLGLLAYPTIAQWWNSTRSSGVGSLIEEKVEQLNVDDREQYIQDAAQYNSELLATGNIFHPNEDQHQNYLNQLSIDGDSVMGTITIPAIGVYLPIYHGTDETVLAVGAGHLEGTSLPVGGQGTHTVITGHRGLPSAKLFTDLDSLAEGDYVVLKVFGEELTYQLDQIRIVLPEEIDDILIEPEKDLLTLVTCTPYGVNTHSMLLTGHRVENLKEWTAVADAHQVDAKMVALFIAIPILILLFIVLMVRSRRPKGEPDEKA